MKKVLLIFLSLLSAASVCADIEVVVTASRLDEDPGTVPATMHILTEDDLERAASLLDALNDVPGISLLSNSGSGNGTYISLGGFGENSFGRVLILVDGLPVNRPDMASFNWLTVPVSRVEKVEILKGPASSLYGDAAVAGVVNIITSRPDKPTIELSAGIDSFLGNRETVSTAYGNPLADVEISLSRKDDRTSRDRTDAHMLSAEASFGIRPLEGLDLSFSGDYTESSYQMPGGLTPEEYTADPDQALNTADEAEEARASVRFSPEYQNNIVALSAPLSFSSTLTDTDFASWFSYSTARLDTIIIAPQAAVVLPLGRTVDTTVSIGSDIRFSRITVDRYPTAEREAPGFSARVSRNSYGIWVRDKTRVSDLLYVDGGIRYELAQTAASSADDPGVDGSAGSSPLVYDAGISFFPSRDLTIGLRYGTTFRYPFLDEQVSYLGYGFDTFYTDLQPESGRSLTATIEYTFLDAVIKFSPYILLMAGEIVYDPALCRNINSTAGALHYGGSISAGYENSIISAKAAYALDRAEYMAGDYAGKVLPLVPLHKVDASLKTRIPGGISIVTTIGYSSGFYMGGDYNNLQSMISGKTNWDIVFVWEPEFSDGLRFMAAGRNILNDRTPTLAYYNSFSSTSSYYPTPGRTFELSGSWSY